MSRSRSRGRSTRSRPRFQRLLFRYGWVLPLAALAVAGGLLALTYAFAAIPLPRDIELVSSAEVYDRNGKLIGIYSGEVRRFLIDARELLEEKPYIGQAVIAAEDKDFYNHNGVSIRGIMRAAWANAIGGEIEQGGSTITQQYVKNAVLHDPSRTVERKVKEAVLAIKTERRYSKPEILAFYLNTIYLGRGAYGIEAAARTYFDKHAEELTLGEAAFLAGIIREPESYQPDENQEAAQARRDTVLARMSSLGYISDDELAEASDGEIELAEDGESSTAKKQTAAYFMEWLRRDVLEPEYGTELYTRGLKIHTTLDLKLQRQAEAAVRSVRQQWLAIDGDNDPQAALVSVTPRGAVRAMVGSSREFRNVRKARGFNFATSFPGRQAGSAFKPFTLMTAIEEGISPASVFSGASPMLIDECAGPDGLPPWEVENYAGASYGTITLDQATTNSVNTVYAQLIGEVGTADVAKTVAALGFDREGTDAEREIPNDACAIALGAIPDVTPLEMARAYATFAARGKRSDISPIRYITDRQNNCIKMYRPNAAKGCEEESLPKYKRVAEQNSVDVLNQVLTHVVQGGTATAANIGRPVAGKTGTTQSNVDAWFAGFVPQLATVVWMGYPAENNGELVPQMGYCADAKMCRPVGGIEVTGGSYPARMWAAYMSQAVAELPVQEFPQPTELPEQILNSPAPAPAQTQTPAPAPEETAESSPTPEETEEPERPSPPPTPDDEPSIVPSPSPTGKGGRGGEDDGDEP